MSCSSRRKASKRIAPMIWVIASFVLAVFVALLDMEQQQGSIPAKGKSVSALLRADVIPNEQPDVCIISNAMKRNSLEVKTYHPLPPISFPMETVPHVTSTLCSVALANNNKTIAAGPNVKSTASLEQGGPTQAVMAFKAARTGSTFFTQVITKTMKLTRRPTNMFWEPFNNRECNGPTSSAVYQENSLQSLLTRACGGKAADRKMPSIVDGEEVSFKCEPTRTCVDVQPNSHGKPVFITALNPRWLNLRDINWGNVFRQVKQPRIFALRRTNLIKMGYSKRHHGGCPVGTDVGSKRRDSYSFDLMLQCTEYFALGDQEISSSVAIQASRAAGLNTGPFLVVYEDVARNGSLVQRELIRYLGLSEESVSEDVFTENARIEKVHKDKFCDYPDVDCDELKRGLGGSPEKYPCLWKQLTRESEELTWSVPILHDGTISIRGDCHPLEPLTESRPVRRFTDLYQLPTSGA